jgi:hypothetical protein
MLLFEINRFTILSESNKTISARIGWGNDGRSDYDEDEEVQEVVWDIQEFSAMEDVLLITEFIRDNNLINNDKIIIDYDSLFEKFKNKHGWTLEKFSNALDFILSIKVDMVDESEKTDFFFVHF